MGLALIAVKVKAEKFHDIERFLNKRKTALKIIPQACKDGLEG
jgi:hypothetical protein